MKRVSTIACVVSLAAFIVTPLWADDVVSSSTSTPQTSVLTLQVVLKRVEQSHPLLQGSQTQSIYLAHDLQP